MLVQNDKDFCLSLWNEDRPMPSINELLAKIEKIVKARKANKRHIWLERQLQARHEYIKMKSLESEWPNLVSRKNTEADSRSGSRKKTRKGFKSKHTSNTLTSDILNSEDK